ncbi:MAG: 1,4-dihydroxy-2-naphthoate polyprenyltransferase [Clostridia bacterium]|nr:1,4-dihydroxy-2-naphthoate polyprenyltransferase [Clostridia bacterium]
MHTGRNGKIRKQKQEKNMAKVLWELTRPHTLTASIVPVLIGTILAMFYVKIDYLLFSAMLAAVLLIQIGTNIFNEYYDFKRGLDTAESVGIGGAIVRHGMKPKHVLYLGLASYSIALLIGVYICSNSSWWLALVGFIGMCIGYLYTGGPLPIAYTPLGELFSGILMGSFFVLISFFIQTNFINSTSVLFSVPMAITVGMINLSNNIRDREEDIKGGRKTLAILLGHKKAVSFLGISFSVAYLWVIVLIIAGIASPWVLLVLFSIPKPLKAVKLFDKNSPQNTNMAAAMKATAQTNTLFGLLICLGLLLDYFF